MSLATETSLAAETGLAAETAAPPPPVATELSPHTRRLLHDPVVPMLLRMAWPNILIMLAQASTGLIETWWVSHLGNDALAGMALVFPPVMLMQMISAGAMGGGISSAIARALGAGRRDDADALVLHAVVINIVLGLAFALLVLSFGRPLYRAMGGEGAALEAALAYSNVVFAGNILLWLMNGLASVIRGTGNMLVPALVICAGIVFLVPLSPLLIFGFGPIPALGVAGGGTALVLYYTGGTIVLGWYILSGRNLARFRWVSLRWPIFRDILRIGAVGAITSLLTNVTIGLATALVSGAAGIDAVAGFGTGARLEYLLIPLVFGLGAPLVALVGTNIGAGHQDRALRIALIGGGISFALTETVGLVAAFWPEAWLALFSAEPATIATGSAYLRIVGPVYGFFGLGLSLYFASQGAGRLFWPIASGFARLFIAIGLGWVALRLTGSLNWFFAALALGLVAYGLMMVGAVKSGTWFRR
ncbi:MATE family efflux transporter [Bosea caraganae]|uniref:MATE family efflux transporter n=1 Tax=Bosea caraganae TaxID=2763117 RepID=A0A370L242_9HYPH|nr:MATE family efflux transporter [Bosea caraganae]RDJ22213.1 MATE family efflux transporter [Bosea caraganae]RDJ22700.1 MATE family efflux transporter [Bosea caraganae]